MLFRKLGFVILCLFAVGIFFPLGNAAADNNKIQVAPTPASPGAAVTNPSAPIPMSGETYSTIAYWFYSSTTGLSAHYQSTQNTSSANSQQIWCDVTYKGIYGPNWWILDNLWKSRWGGGNLTVNGSKGVSYGSYNLHGHGTHLFDYGSNNWVWKYSDDYETYEG